MTTPNQAALLAQRRALITGPSPNGSKEASRDSPTLFGGPPKGSPLQASRPVAQPVNQDARLSSVQHAHHATLNRQTPVSVPHRTTQSPAAQAQPSKPPVYNDPITAPGAMPLQDVGNHVKPAYSEVSSVIERADPTIVRQVIRDSWQKCLLGTEFHSLFLTDMILHRATPEVLGKIAREFGGTLLRDSGRDLLGHLTEQTIDQYAESILSKASPTFLDMALERRLDTIPAQRLLNALARAERLGYDIGDVVEEKSNARGEHVIPSMTIVSNILSGYSDHQPTSSSPSIPPPAPLPSSTLSSTAPPSSLGIKTCQGCLRPCTNSQALEYHLRKRACGPLVMSPEIFKTICIHCGCRFGGKGGLDYHLKSRVCGQFSQAQINMMSQALAQAVSKHQAHQTHQTHQTSINHPLQNPNNNTTPRPPATPDHASTDMPVTTSTYDHTAHQHRAGLPVGVPATSGDFLHMIPHDRKLFIDELRMAEEKYGGLLGDAEKLPEPQRSNEIAKVKNRWNTKQSTTRKKFGISLRAERTPRNEGTPPSSQAAKIQKTSHQSSSPRGREEQRRQMVSVDDMGGGLTEASATAETNDPTSFLTPSQPRYQPPPLSKTTSSSVAEPVARGVATGQVADDPMNIDSGSETEESSSDDDDAGIPA